MAKAAAKKSDGTGAKFGFGTRLRAWWEGYDTEDYARLNGLLDSETADVAAATVPLQATVAKQNQPAEPARDEARPEAGLAVDPWNRERSDVAQLIWGPGYCGPGGPEHVIAMSKLLAMNSELSVMHVGAGLGGPARTLAEEFDTWVTGFETSQALVDAGNALSKMAGMAKKVPMKLLDMAAEPPFDRKYDRAIFDYYFNREAELEPALSALAATIKEDGLVLITDYFVKHEQTLGEAAYRDWAAGEPTRPNLRTAAALTDAFTKAGFQVRVDEDRTQEYCGLINKTWANAAEVVAELMGEPGQVHLAQVVLGEAELWNRRAELMKQGVIEYRRILAAAKAKPGSKMMSNW